MDLVKYEKGEGAKTLHLQSVRCQDTETLCGIFMGGGIPEEIEGDKPTCPECILMAKTILARYSKKSARTWGKN